MNTMAQQRGVALLTALLIVAILTTVTVMLSWDQMLAIRRSQDLIEQDQARELCLGAEAWAAQSVAKTARRQEVDLQQPWAQPMPVIPIDGGEVTGSLEDLQGRLNLNNLVSGNQVVGISRQRFNRLLQRVKLPIDLGDAVIDWIDPDDIPRGAGGAEDGFYMGMLPPYRAANMPMLSASSLRLVRGFDAKAYAAIIPWVTALPAGTSINLNTAPEMVLETLGLSADQVAAMIKLRDKHPFKSLAAFLSNPILQGQKINSSRLSVRSQFFLLRAEARLGKTRTILYSVLRVENPDKVRVIMRSWNTSP